MLFTPTPETTMEKFGYHNAKANQPNLEALERTYNREQRINALILAIMETELDDDCKGHVHFEGKTFAMSNEPYEYVFSYGDSSIEIPDHYNESYFPSVLKWFDSISK